MKIVFDSEKEKEKCIEALVHHSEVCPYELGISLNDKCASYKCCKDCWENNLNYEVLQEVPVVETVPVEEFIEAVEKEFKEVPDENHI